MSKDQNPEKTKCIAVNLPIRLVRKLEEYKAKVGKSKNQILVEFVKQGLKPFES